jgi:hypothetical protein
LLDLPQKSAIFSSVALIGDTQLCLWIAAYYSI